MSQDGPSASTPAFQPSLTIVKTDRREFFQGLGSLFVRATGALALTSSSFGCGGGSERPPAPQRAQPDQAIPSEGYVRLAFNESPYGPPQEAVAAVEEMLARPYAIESPDSGYLPGINRYPDFLNTELTERIALLHSVGSIQVIPCCGISELLYMCSQAFLGNGRTLVMTDSTFPLLRYYAQQRGADVTLVPAASDHHVDLDGLLHAVGPETGLVYLANPDNPTGTLLAFQEIKEFVEAVSNRNRTSIVLVDEAYMEYVDTEPLPEAIPLVWQYPVIVGRTFSKAYGLAGLRGGYAIVNEDVSLTLNGFLSGYLGGDPGWRMFEGNVNRLAGAAMLAGLSPSGNDFVTGVRTKNSETRQYLAAGLASLGYTSIESHANFLLVDLGTEGEKVRNWLARRKILVQAGGSFHPRYRQWIRISVGDRIEIETFLDVLAGYDPSSASASPPSFAVFYRGF